MKYAILTVLFCLPLFVLGQTETTSTEEAYATAGLELEVVQEMMMRVTGLDADQASEAMMPFLGVINRAKKAGGVAVMGEDMVVYFTETWGITAEQIKDLERVAGRFAGGVRRR
jgi:hypothetical protein